MRSKIEEFKINGKPILNPDSGISMEYKDIESRDSGTDQNGIYHRLVTRHKVTSWKFTYSNLTEEEKQYMEGLFPDEPTFEFAHPSRTNSTVMETTVCYRSKYCISWKNARTGLWGGCSFNIIEC